jgi:hypothetical protein
MRAEEHTTINCDFCSRGRIVKHTEEITFRQWSDKGHVNCRAEVEVGICDVCGAGSLEPGADKIFDEAFRREYARHARQMRAG